MQKQIFTYNHPFELESGKVIPSFHLAYTVYGELNEEKDNVVWIFHALTANSEPHDWWDGLVGERKFFNPREYFIICANIPGSCYGSLSPLDKNPETGNPYYHDFPLFTIGDIVRSFILLRKYLGIKKIKVGLGGSMGGQQLLEWSIREADLFEYILPIATAAKQSPWAIALNAIQRMCIENDITWKNKDDKAGIEGMKIARAMALLSYRNYNIYTSAQQGETEETKHLPIDQKIWRAETYQRYQGEKLGNRFNAFSYYFISKTLDTFDLSRNRGGDLSRVLKYVKAKTMVIGISSDLLFPPVEQQFLGDNILCAKIKIIDSFYGHDGFLLEFEKIESIIRDFIK